MNNRKMIRKRVVVLLTMALLLGLVSGTSPIRVQATETAAGVQGGAQAASLTHSHDMSVECGHDASLEYLPLTGNEYGECISMVQRRQQVKALTSFQREIIILMKI